MPRYLTKKKRLIKIEAGSLNSRISIFIRELKAPVGSNNEYREIFTKRLDVWAFIDTIDGVTVFDNTNIERVISHDFYIRYIPDVTIQLWLEYKHQRYNIHSVENYGLENKFYRLRTSLTGDIDKEATKA